MANPKHIDGSGRYFRVERMIDDGEFEDLEHKEMFIDRMYACGDSTFDAIFNNHLDTFEDLKYR